MCGPNTKFRNLFPQMESVVRVSNIPVIENSLKLSGKLYAKLKLVNTKFATLFDSAGLRNTFILVHAFYHFEVSDLEFLWINAYDKTIILQIKNPVLNWLLNSAESMFFSSAELIKPLFDLIQEPVSKFDNFLCKTLDFVELNVPSVYMPPEMIYQNTKEYMSDHIVRAVLKRANSVKQIGTVASSYASHRIDGAPDVADHPSENKSLKRSKNVVSRFDFTKQNMDNSIIAVCDARNSDEMQKESHGFQRGKQFSRKLKRRLTQRTVAEAKALKKQSREAIHILVYATELVFTNPKRAICEAKKLWNYLSEDEPENQARPHTLEQLIVLLTRELFVSINRKCNVETKL